MAWRSCWIDVKLALRSALFHRMLNQISTSLSHEAWVDVWVFRQPAVDLGFVGVQVIQDDVNFLIRVVHNEFVHKAQKLPSSASLEVTGFDQTGRHVQGGEQGGRTVAFILVVETRQSSAIGQFEPSLGALQRLDCGLLVYAKNDGILGRIQSTCPRWRRPLGQTRGPC